MLPRVAFEYGHTSWAARTSSTAASASVTEGRVTSRPTSSLKPPLPSGEQRDLGLDRGVADLGLRAARDDAEGALEAGGVADREQLLGVGAAARTAHLGGNAQIDLERAVAGAAVTLGAAAGHVRLGGVQRVRHRLPLVRWSDSLRC